MKNKINLLIYEKQQLLNQIKTQEKTIKEKRNSWTHFQSPKFEHKRNISFTDFSHNKVKNQNICFTESNNNEIEKNNNYKEMENRLHEENSKLNTENINNKENPVLYDKRLNKRKYIFNKKKTSKRQVENIL